MRRPRITTGPGPGGGPHIATFEAVGDGPIVGFMDGNETGGKRVARGDVNGDGVDEIITGSGPDTPAIVSVYSATGSLIGSNFAYGGGTFRGGIFVAAGDINDDGKDEIVTAPGPGGGPHVRIWTVNGSTVAGNDGFMAYTPSFAGGVTVAVGDFNGDGNGDILTGPGAGGGPHVRAFSGTNNGAELFGLMAYTAPNGQPNWTGGVNVGAGNLDGSGADEVVVAPWPGGGPHVKTFNSNGSLRHPGVFAGTPTFPGGITLAVGDLDGNGSAEIVVGTMKFFTVFRAFDGDLNFLPRPNREAYPNFPGGVFVSIGTQ